MSQAQEPSPPQTNEPADLPLLAELPETAAVLARVLDALRVGVVVIDRMGRIVVMNRMFGEMVQEAPAGRIGQSVFLCHPAKSRPAIEQLVADLAGGVKDHVEGFANYKGRIVYEYLYALRDGQGRCIGIVDELHDAGDRAELMRRLGEWRDLPVSGEGDRAPQSAGKEPT